MSTPLRSAETDEGPGSEVRACPLSPSGRAEMMIRKILVIPEAGACPADPTARAGGDASTYRVFHLGMTISAARCLLSYVVFPVVTPLVGAATTVGPMVGLPIAVIALFFNVMGIRRFWASNHRWRWTMTFIYAGVMSLVLALLVGDVAALV